jgi:hypothetical protein
MNIDALYHWVTESTRNAHLPDNNTGNTIEKRVQRLIDTQEPLSKKQIVYRVHSPNSKPIIPYSWFATSSDLKKVLLQHLTKNADCCLFKINVMPGIRILDVDKILNSAGKSTDYDESEIIVDGKGFFTHPSDKSGFYKVGTTNGITTFETYYEPKLKNIKKITANEIFNSFIPDEFDFINSINNVKNFYRAAHKNAKVNNETF